MNEFILLYRFIYNVIHADHHGGIYVKGIDNIEILIDCHNNNYRHGLY